MPNAVIHPSTQELSAFALGKLSDAAAAAVARHLETCPACRKAIEKLPADSFVGKLRAARPSVSSLPAGTGDNPKLPVIAAAPSPTPEDLPPDLANYSKYRFVRELGRGGMGVVYQAEQTVMGRTVAVKVINPSVLNHPDALPRFQAEVRAAARLDHPNIVRAHDAEQVGSMHLLIMEYVEGTSLAELVAKKGPQSIAYACHYVRQAALGLQHAFEQGMVHRDIKPHNLMVNARGQVKVLDFGLARMRSEQKAGGGLTQVDAFMGTPEYVSPEQATDAHSADTRADIYSLGCTLFFLLAGRPPFQGDTAVKLIMAHIEKEAPSLHELRADVPAELSAVVARMLAKDPARRFQVPLEVAQALAAFVKPGTKPAAGVALPASGVSSPGTGTAIAVGTSKIKAILRDVPGKTPSGDAPAEEPTSAFEGLGEEVASVKKKAKPARKTAKPAPKAWYQRWPVLAGAGAAMLALGLGAWLLAGIVFKTKVKTADGEAYVVLEIDQPDAEVTVDGKKISVHVPGDNKPIEIQVEPDRSHKLRVRKDGFEVVSRDVELKSGRSAPIRVRLEPVKPRNKDEEWIQKVAALPVDKQADAVAAKLKALNPGFVGAVHPTIENGVVSGLGFVTDHVTDLSPLRALVQLKSLSCGGSAAGKGQLADLSPLKGMSLTKLFCEANQISDLSPLEGMPLEHLDCLMNPIADLSPLTGMPLKVLGLWGWNGKDLKPLKGMPLTWLNCGGNGAIEDLSPLEGMSLTWLCVNCTKVSDLTPLKGMPLKNLLATDTRVSDLTPLKGVPLTFLTLPPSVKDLSPLKAMSLKEILCPFQPERDAGILRSIKTLEKINDKQADEFWKEVDGAKKDEEKWIREVSALPAEQQIERVKTKLKELNPGFDGAVGTLIENKCDVVLDIVTDHVTDIRPLRALPGLKRLWASSSDKGKLADLSPLKGIHLTELNCRNNNQISDLSPLEGMPLTFLACGSSQVSDLSPLKGMPLIFLGFAGTQVSDLSPLKGMKLTGLSCHTTKVSDLSPLKGMHLAELYCDKTRVSDLSPLKGMPLVKLGFAGTQVSDLSPLKDLPLKILRCDFRPERDAEILRSIKTLEEINGKPAAQYWKEVDEQKREPILPPPGTPPGKADGFVPLFNGKDTKGWKTHAKQRGNWRVVKGVLIGSGPATSHLYSSRGDYKNFHLRVEARINDGGNSGVYFRARFGPILPANNPMFPQGYEAQINANHGDPKKTGSLIGIINLAEAPHKPNEWFTEEVIAQGSHLIIKVNGRTTADYTDDKRLFTSGHIALQQADPGTIAEFRKIEIEEFPRTKP